MVEAIDSKNRFNVMVNQVVVAVGSDVHTEHLRKVLQPLNFVQYKIAKMIRDIDFNAQFLVVVVDFSNMPAVQALARFITSIENFSGVMSVYALAPETLNEQDLLFSVELGIKRTFFGKQRDEELRGFIKQYALEVTEHGSMAFIEAEVMRAISKGTEEALRLQCEKLSQMDKSSEDVNRLQALLYEARSDYKRMEFHLKQTLRINPQNLWAANYLGRFYLRNRRVAEGIEILKKLSRFHELNSERMLTLGDAYLNAGRAEEAKNFLDKGDNLTGGTDERFAEGLAKVEVLRGDMQSALAKIGKKYLSAPVLAFLNTRAVMAARAERPDEALKLYQEAIMGCSPEEKIVTAKLWFNKGLAHVRLEQMDQAIIAFTSSRDIGGKDYDRAAKTLEKAKKLKVKGPKNTPSTEVAKDLSDIEYESFS